MPDGFLLNDIKKGDPVNFRTLIYAKKEQLNLLHRALLWTVDGTHELVQEPYQQLVTIQAFVRCKGNIRLVPFVFAVMTSHTTVAYKEVFETIINSFPPEWGPPKVQEVLCDFEAAIWAALRAVIKIAIIIRLSLLMALLLLHRAAAPRGSRLKIDCKI